MGKAIGSSHATLRGAGEERQEAPQELEVGFIHGAKLGVGESAQVALGYLLLALICWVLARRPAEA